MEDAVENSLKEFENEVHNLEQILKPLLEVSMDELRAVLTPFENAKLSLLIAYAINTLFFSMLPSLVSL